MELEIKKPQTVNARVVKIHAKCSDCCSTQLFSDKGEIIHESDGYVPDFMPGDHHGDYIILNIDLDTGHILNWPKITANKIQTWIGEEN